MANKKKQLHLGAFVGGLGHHVAAWRYPDSRSASGPDLAHVRHIAKTAERGKFDSIFFGDIVALLRQDPESIRRSAVESHFEPITLLAGLSAVTERIGLIATASTTYNQPYSLARQFASLDHLSGGRVGWNVVSSISDGEARNFGYEAHPEHALRYERAGEFVDVVTGLWDSWEDDAFVRDKDAGVYADPAKVHTLNHKGDFFRVRGPLNIARSPQGRPVVVQAGSSEPGKELAARTAELVFTAQHDLKDAQEFYRDIKGRTAKYGRKPGDVKILPGLLTIVGTTKQEAEDKFERLQSLVDPIAGLQLLSTMLGGFDLSGYPIDGPLPQLPESNGNKSRRKLIEDMAASKDLSIRQLYLAIAGARGHGTIIGTPSQIADRFQEWLEVDAADGFNVMPPYLPGALDDFVDLVVPELQRRGIFRTEYEGTTLREHLGLARPANQFAANGLSLDNGNNDSAQL
jgi:alkanesulfonate monooxygenase